MQQNKIQILCTRPVNTQLIQQAALQDIFIDTLNFIETENCVDQFKHNEINALAGKDAVVVITSMNAAEAVIAALNNNKPSWKFFCIGGATKKIIASYFGADSIIDTASYGSDLARKITEHDSIKEVVFFCGNIRGEDIPDILKKNSIHVNEMIVYKTILTPHKAEKMYDGILFFSPSAVRSFFSQNKALEKTVFFSIGNTTTAAIQSNCNNKIVVSEWQDKELMIKQAITFFENKKQVMDDL